LHIEDRGHLEKVVLSCIILHNTIAKDEEPEDIEENLDLNEPSSTTTVEELEFFLEDFSTHKQLKRARPNIS
jgi:hypothetical protein